jgi:ribosome-associated protein
MTRPYEAGVDPYVKAVLGMKAFDVVVLDLHGLASFADTFIICSGRSHRQVSAIAEFVEENLKAKGIKEPSMTLKASGQMLDESRSLKPNLLTDEESSCEKAI